MISIVTFKSEPWIRIAEQFDPSVFEDDLALQTLWTPAASGGATFGTHRLKQTSRHRVVFRPSLLLWFLASVCLAFTVRMAFTFADQVHLAIPEDQFTLIFTSAWLFVLTIFTTQLLWYISTVRQFDKRYHCYWKGRKNPARSIHRQKLKDYTPFNDIYALQIIQEHCSQTGKDGFMSFELNLVLGDTKRVNIVDHSNLAGLRHDAKTLAEFLGQIPIWDATLYADTLPIPDPNHNE